MRARLLDECRNRHVIQHKPGIVDDPVLAVGCVWIEGHVGDYAETGHDALEFAHRALRETIGVPGLAPVLRLGRWIGDRKQGDGGNAETGETPRLRDKEVDAQALDAGHRGNGLAPLASLDDEQGLDQVIGRDPGLPGEAARKQVAAHAPWPGIRIAPGDTLAHEAPGPASAAVESAARGRK